MSPHGAFTESSLSPHHRKGREGKGTGNRSTSGEARMHRHLGEATRPATMHAGFADSTAGELRCP